MTAVSHFVLALLVTSALSGLIDGDIRAWALRETHQVHRDISARWIDASNHCRIGRVASTNLYYESSSVLRAEHRLVANHPVYDGEELISGKLACRVVPFNHSVKLVYGEQQSKINRNWIVRKDWNTVAVGFVKGVVRNSCDFSGRFREVKAKWSNQRPRNQNVHRWTFAHVSQNESNVDDRSDAIEVQWSSYFDACWNPRSILGLKNAFGLSGLIPRQNSKSNGGNTKNYGRDREPKRVLRQFARKVHQLPVALILGLSLVALCICFLSGFLGGHYLDEKRRVSAVISLVLGLLLGAGWFVLLYLGRYGTSG